MLNKVNNLHRNLCTINILGTNPKCPAYHNVLLCDNIGGRKGLGG